VALGLLAALAVLFPRIYATTARDMVPLVARLVGG
jgi:hypothetical protein